MKVFASINIPLSLGLHVAGLILIAWEGHGQLGAYLLVASILSASVGVLVATVKGRK